MYLNFYIFLFIRRIPFPGIRTSNIQSLITHLYAKVAFFQNPFAIITHESKVGAFHFQRNGFRFSRLQFYFLKSTQAADIRSQGSDQIATEQQNAFLADTVTGVLHINGESKYIVSRKVGFIRFEVAVSIGSVAQSVTKCPLHGHRNHKHPTSFQGLRTACSRK